jgi:2-isopropylmalate synthase
MHAPHRYRPFTALDMPNRQWPNKRLTQAPIWMSTDLRDGNQSLFEPLDLVKKHAYFELLCQIGFKEIEIGFPSASQIEFDFVRQLIEQKRVPDDVTLEVLTQARLPLIERSFESLVGAKSAIMHYYNATAENFRRLVFNADKAACIAIAVEGAQHIKRLAAQYPDTDWTFQYSPEMFSTTEMDFALEICERVCEVWQPQSGQKVILNLPATVEAATPNHYADQIEWFCQQLSCREHVIVSVHPHNDRGCGVAAAELAVLAGADRVEGCLFGNGERSGNVDLVTLALNLYSQGVDSKLDFSQLPTITRQYEQWTGLPVHPRHPYAGDLVFTAFSGSHQDAIKKGLSLQSKEGFWEVPYLPVDPQELGRNYDSIIRVNSQSGKGGISYLLEKEYGLVMPRRMQIEFSAVVQQAMDDTGKEYQAADLWALFQAHYLHTQLPFKHEQMESHENGSESRITWQLKQHGQAVTAQGLGNGPLEAAMKAISTLSGIDWQIHSFEERSLSHGSNAQAMAFVELSRPHETGTLFGAGLSHNILQASIQALLSAVNRSMMAK